MNSLNKYKYKLESHLKLLCEENKEYVNLYSSWSLNKKTYANILSAIQINYPHYSLHDSSHSDAIITNIEMLLGEEGIKKLSPTDTWLILNSAYVHDFGMVLLYSNIEEKWRSPEFKAYLDALASSSNGDLKEAVKYITNLKDNIQDEAFELSWPVKIRKCVTEIISSYFREKHSSITREYLNKLEHWKLDLTQNGLIHIRLVKLLGEISFLHSQSFLEILKLDYVSNGYNSDYIHPRFVAELIRLGDLLDLDNGRFNEYIEKVIGDLPYLSRLHKEKHKATSHLLVTPDNIEVRVDCKDYDVYRETRSWISWLQEEIRNLTIHWTDIIPKNLNWYAPKLTKVELLINGEPDTDDLSDLKFEISQKKAFEIIEGSNLYENKLTFLREFIQNALDASKKQLWRDLSDGLYSWIKEPYSKLTPFDIEDNIYESYKLKILIDSTSSEIIKVTIIDKGVGMDVSDLKDICNVGSNQNSKREFQEETKDMPLWLKPTGGFGIGMQSGFLIADQFKADTRTARSDTLEVTFESVSSEGYISVRSSSKKIKRGTKMTILVPELSNLRYSLGDRVHEFLVNEYDPLIGEGLTLNSIIEYICENIESNLFDIEIYIDNQKIKTIESFTKKIKIDNEDNKEERYIFTMPRDLNHMIIWDREESIYFVIKISNNDISRNKAAVYFKGCHLKKEDRIKSYGLNIIIDIYGLETKNSIKIDRTKLTEEGYRKIKIATENAVNFFLNKTKQELDKLLSNSGEPLINFSISNFLLICSTNKNIESFKPAEYQELLNEKLKVKVLTKNNGCFEYSSIPLKDLIEIYPNLVYVNIYDFFDFSNSMNLEYTYESIREFINEKKETLSYETIVVDKLFIEILREFLVEKIQYIDTKEINYMNTKIDRELFIYTIDTSKTDISKANIDEKTENHFIKNLVVDTDKSATYNNITFRCSIPVIGGFEGLGINSTSCNVPGRHNAKFRIISPITKSDSDKINDFGCSESFIRSIANREDYKKLILKTHCYQASPIKLSKEEISELYKGLIGRFFDLQKERVD